MGNNIIQIQDKIKAFNKLEFTEFEGYLLGSFFAVSYYEIIYSLYRNQSKGSLIAKTILKCLIKDYKYEFNAIPHNKIVLFFSHEHGRRSDYVEFMQDIQQLIDGSVCFTGKDTRKHILISKEAIKNLRLLSCWYNSISKIEKDGKTRWILMAKISMAYRWKMLLEKNKKCLINARGYITIFDAREYENILAQFSRINCIKTATLQHGHFTSSYYIDDNTFGLGIPFEGFVSDQFWVWGEYTLREAIHNHISKDAVIVTGYPKPIRKKLIPPNNNTIGVILDGGNAVQINKHMIKIAVEFALKHGFRLVLKPHPKDTTDFQSICDVCAVESYINRNSLSEIVDKAQFFICNNSTAYIDLLCLGAKIYRYSSTNHFSCYKNLPVNDTFTDADELYDLIQRKVSSGENRYFLIGAIGTAKTQYNHAASILFKH